MINLTQKTTPRRSSYEGRSSSPNRGITNARAPPPQSKTQAPPQQKQGGGFMSQMAGTMMQGMAFGAGSEVAHQGIRSLMGGSSHHETVDQQHIQYAPAKQQNSMCLLENSNFVDCLKFNNNQISRCQSFFDTLKLCEQNAQNM